MRPIIGILSTYSEDTQRDYIKAVERAGGTSIILSMVEDIQSLKSILEKIDGIIFTGGSDINSRCYQENPQHGLGTVLPERDYFEVALVKKVLTNTDIFVLGICRGMQLLNIVAGGSLYQNLETANSNGFNHWLKDHYSRYYPSHEVSIKNPSKLYSIFKRNKIFVNSFHHQGLKALGEGLRSTMLASDGTIEAIEMEGERFIVGVQWHPEMMVESYPQYLDLFKTFIMSCQNLQLLEKSHREYA